MEDAVSTKISRQAALAIDKASNLVREETGTHISRIAVLDELVERGDVVAVTRSLAKRKNGKKTK